MSVRVACPLAAVLLGGCYLSHAPPEDVAPEVVEPGVDGDPCIIVQTECEPPRPVHRSETCPWSLEACAAEDSDDGGYWCCISPPVSRRAVEVDGACRFDTEACLAFEEVAPVRSAAELAADVPTAATLVTVEGTVSAIHVDTDQGRVSALSLDGALRLAGAPCGVSFECADDAHCAPVAAGSAIRVTGWINATLMVCVEPLFGQPTLDVVSVATAE